MHVVQALKYGCTAGVVPPSSLTQLPATLPQQPDHPKKHSGFLKGTKKMMGKFTKGAKKTLNAIQVGLWGTHSSTQLVQHWQQGQGTAESP